jgi:large subunit GTPase 1
MQLAELSRRKFEAEKGGAHVVYHQETIEAEDNEGMISKFATGQPKTQLQILKVPRRPEWTKEMTAEEITRNENDAFLEWRR